MKRFNILPLLLLFSISASGADYYWVGGAGNWSDISKWATTSGGTTQHNQIPTADDRVIFDANSFTGPGQVVTVNNQTIFCRDMIWDGVTGNPRFVGPADFSINIFGSLRLSAAMSFDFEGDVRFVAGDGGHEIDLAGHTLRRDVFFDGNNGTWTLQSDFILNRLLTIAAGTLNTNDQEIRCQHLRVRATNPVMLNLSSSRLLATGIPFPDATFPGIIYPVVEFFADMLTLNAANSTIELSSDNPFFQGRGMGDLALGTLLFSNTAGNGRLFSEPTLSFRFQRVEMRNDTRIEGMHNLGNLVLGPGKTFIFQAGRTYNLSALTAEGSCIAPIQLFSSSPGETVTFVSNAATISGDYLSLRDIHGTGSANYTADNSADLGNNTGWTIMPKANNQLYWVGGTGNWYDAANWSFTSGGPGGACVPTAGDDVFFDANSFNAANGVVTINVENAYCRSMDWTGATGNPRLEGTVDQNIRIFGSLTFIANMQLPFAGNFYFEGSSPGNTITSAGKVLRRDAIFNGSGDWTLLDDFEAETDIILMQGRLNSNDQTVTCQLFDARFPSARALSMGSSTFVLRYLQTNNKQRSYVLWQATSTNFQLDAGTSTIDFQFFGFMYHYGEPPLNYNRIITRRWIDFRNQGENFSAVTQPVFIDYLTTETEGRYFGHHVINRWELTPAYAHQIGRRDTLTVTEIIAPVICEGMIEIRCVEDDDIAYFIATQDQTIENFILKDVHSIGPGTVTANNSVDLGNTDGWVINDRAPRDLYWVGGAGSWFDTARWSLSSGGPGGECLPTPVDNVFFDANSFTAPNQFVNADDGRYAYCHNMTWEGVTQTPRLSMYILNAFGSVTLVPQMTVNNFNNLRLRSENPGQTLTTAGHRFFNFLLAGSGSWIVQDEVRASFIGHENGTFNSNDAPIFIQYYYYAASTASPKLLQLGESYWMIEGALPYSFAVFTNNLTIEPGTSVIEMQHPNAQIESSGTVSFHNALFSNIEGTSTVQVRFGNTLTFNRLEFRNNGTMLGQSIADSLIFSAGKAYRLDVNHNQRVNEYFQVLGNNCNSIELSSTLAGMRSVVEMNGGNVRGDFIQMRDQEGRGSTQFFAGANSTNIGNSNINWIFDTPREYAEEGILGEDVVLCNTNALVLDANTFNPNEQYRWQDGSTNATFNVTQPGIYWVEVSYDNNCVLRDSVNVLPAQAFAPALPGDTDLCEGETLLLDPGLGLVGVRFLWQDGSTEPTFTVTQAGTYKVTLELSGCEASDSLEVRYTSTPVFDLGAAQTLCPGETTMLNANYPNMAEYRWQDGSTNASFTVTQPGVYTLGITENGCTGRDSVEVFYNAPFNLNIGNDTTFCENSQLTLSANVSGATYRWSDGSTNATLTLGVPGIYWLEATLDNCTERDSVTVTEQPLPRFDLGTATTFCEGETTTLDGTSLIGNATYEWNDGSTTPQLTVNSAGVYRLTATLNGCSFSDERALVFNPLPTLDLGDDQTRCEGETAILMATNAGATYRWQDGSTNDRFAVTTSGLYTVEVNLNGCLRSDSVQFTFNPLPVFSLGVDTTLCEGESLPLTANVANATFLWNDNSTAPTRTISAAGLFWLEVSLDGCSRRDSIAVQFVTIPDNFLGNDLTLCEGETRTLDPGIPGATYRWQDGSTNATFTVTQAGSINVEARVSGCSGEDSIEAFFNPLPRFTLGRDTSLCSGETLELRTNVVADAIRWQDGSTGPTLTLSTSGLYWAQATRNGCSWADSLQVQVLNAPQFSLGDDILACDDTPVVLQANTNAERFLWSEGSTTPNLTVDKPGVYTLEASNGRCATVSSVQVDFRRCLDFKLFAPNAFSPDGDGVNDVFQPYFQEEIVVRSYVMRIFDRWGNLIFISDEWSRGWDGSWSGQRMPTGVYLYQIIIAYTDDRGEGQATFAGDVVLLR